MPYKDPNNYNFITYAWMLFIACWGGVVNYISRLKKGVVKTFSFAELMGELTISAFSGVITYWICQSYEVEPLMTAVWVAISGHAGGRTVFVLEDFFNSKLDRLIGRTDGDSNK